tara:strand:- start:63 stop:374 length:312 start_codon:yes stop_codon:yes gene_type:complete
MTSNVYINVSGTWKQADDVYVNVSGTWKTATEVQARISSEWKGVASGGGGASGLPTYSQIVGLDYVDFTLPTISVVTSKSSIDGFTLDNVDFTLPVIGITNTN